MKSYNLLDECIINQANEEFIFKNEISNKPFILSNIKDIKKYYSKHKCNIYQYINYNKEIRVFFNIILNNNKDDFDEIINYNIKLLKFNLNDLIIYQKDDYTFTVIHKYYYMNDINELSMYLVKLNLINIKIETNNFLDTLLNDSIITDSNYMFEDTIINNVETLLKLEDNNNNIKIINKYDKYVGYINFDINDTIFIKSNMGSGKSTSVVNYIKMTKPKRFLIISCRKSLTYSICEKLESNNIDVDNYLKLKKEKIKLSNKLIISPDSIYKIEIPLKKYDLIWIDEATSLMRYIANFLILSENLNKDTIIIIEWLLRNCKNLLITDADLDLNSINYYLCYRKIQNSILINYNNFIDKNEYIIFNDKNEMNKKLKCDLINQNNIYICTDSLKTSKEIYKYICNLSIIDKNKILLYNSESDKIYEKKMYSVNDFWSEYNLVIVSPKIVMGVDFIKEHFDYIYGYYNCRTLSYKESFQQIGRIRNLRKNTVNIYIENSIKKSVENNIINIKYDLTNYIIENIFYKKSIDIIEKIFNILHFKINNLGYKYLDINNSINYLLLYSLYEKNLNLKNFIELFKRNIALKND